MFIIEIRRTIRTETAKMESFNDFLDWISFGKPAVKSGVPVEQEKRIKCAGLAANTVMLCNVDTSAHLTIWRVPGFHGAEGHARRAMVIWRDDASAEATAETNH